MSEQNKTPERLYLRVIGRLYDNQSLRLRPGYLSATPPRPVRRLGEGRLFAETFDAHDTMLGRFALDLSRPCAFGASREVPALTVRGWVPFHPATAYIRYLLDGCILSEVRRNKVPPHIELEWRPTELVESRQCVTWKADAGLGAALPLQFFLRYSCNAGRRWQRIGLRTDDHFQEVDFDSLPGGSECRLMLVATDGIDTTTTTTESFRVRAKPLVVSILLPTDGTGVAAGDRLMCMGSAYSMEHNSFESRRLWWSSSLDGELGDGRMLDMVLLSPGVHCIKLTAKTEEQEGSSEVTVRVNAKDNCAQTVELPENSPQ